MIADAWAEARLILGVKKRLEHRIVGETICPTVLPDGTQLETLVESNNLVSYQINKNRCQPNSERSKFYSDVIIGYSIGKASFCEGPEFVEINVEELDSKKETLKSRLVEVLESHNLEVEENEIHFYLHPIYLVT